MLLCDIRKGRKDDGLEVARLDCTEVDVVSAAELKHAVDRGFRQRKVASTTMNADSSRSHLLFTKRARVSVVSHRFSNPVVCGNGLS